MTHTTGDKLKARGQARALRHAGSEWLRVALDEFRHWLWGVYIAGERAIALDTFRAEKRCPEPASPNAWGALPLQAMRKGWLLPSPQTIKSFRPDAHARRLRMWTICPDGL